jgi:tripartite-type tricarboxylate transporter receptor subunit TctC
VRRGRSSTGALGYLAVVTALLAVACAPAAPSPTAAPAKPAPTEAPKAAQPAAKPTEVPAAKPAEAKPALSKAEGPAASPAAKAEAQPAGSPATKMEAKPAASPAPRAAYDEKTVADFYRGKTMRIIVGASAGGGYDTYSRVIARHMGKYIPGNPTVIVENMPGASFALAANHVYGPAPKDGTVIGNISGWLVLDQLFGTKGIEFDLARFGYVGVPVSETYILIVTKKPGVTKFEEILGPNSKQIVLGSSVDQAPIVVRDVLGANIKLVTGYGGTADVRRAMENGEVDGFVNTWESTKITNRQDVDSGNWIILAQLPDKRVRDIPGNAPIIPDIARNEEHRLLLLYGTSYPNQFQKLYLVGPGVPPERTAALQDAFTKTLADKDFLADADKSRLDTAPMSAEAAQKLVLEMLNMSPDVKGKLQQIMKPA